MLNETAEFCRNLGARQMSYEMEQGRRRQQQQHRPDASVDDDLLDFEESLRSGATRRHEERMRDRPSERGRWEEVSAFLVVFVLFTCGEAVRS